MKVNEFEDAWKNSVSEREGSDHKVTFTVNDIKIYADNYSIERSQTVYFYLSHRLSAVANLKDIVAIY